MKHLQNPGTIPVACIMFPDLHILYLKFNCKLKYVSIKQEL